MADQSKIPFDSTINNTLKVSLREVSDDKTFFSMFLSSNFTHDQTIATDEESAEDFAVTRIGVKPVFNPSPLASEERFEVKSKLGEGGAGRVMLAVDKDIHRNVAVKFFKGENVALLNCRREIQINGKIDHPGVPPVHDVGVGVDGTYYLVMKYVDGETLGNVIKKLQMGDEETHAKYSFARRAELMVQLLRILVETHKNGIIHRDIKPENLLIDSTGHLYLMDWGISLDLSKEKGNEFFCGTPKFMSPEQVDREVLDGRSDLYSTCAVFYEFFCLFHYLPKPQDLPELFSFIREEKPVPMDLRPHLTQGCAPSEYAWFVQKGLNKKVEDRHPSAQQMLDELVAIQSGEFSGKCHRTRIKSKVYVFNRWLDKNPYQNVYTFYAFIVFVLLLMVFIGFLLGRLSFFG